MSIQALNWAFQQKVQSSSQKFVLVALSNFANENCESYPAVSTLADLTGLDRKTVILGLDALLKVGLITDTGKRKGFTASVKVYLLSSPKNGTVPKTDESSPVFPTKQSRFSVKQSQKRDTEPSGTVREPKGNQNRPRFPKEIKDQIQSISEEIQRLKDFGRTKEEEDEKQRLIARRKELRKIYHYT